MVFVLTARAPSTRCCFTLKWLKNYGVRYCCTISRLREDEGAVPSGVAEAYRKQLDEIDEVVRREQQVSPDEVR